MVLRGPTTLLGVLNIMKKSTRAGAIGLTTRPAAAGRDLLTGVLNFLQSGRREEAFILPEEVLEGRSTTEKLLRESFQSSCRGQQLQGGTTLPSTFLSNISTAITLTLVTYLICVAQVTYPPEAPESPACLDLSMEEKEKFPFRRELTLENIS